MVFYEKRAGKCGKELKMSLIKGIIQTGCSEVGVWAGIS